MSEPLLFVDDLAAPLAVRRDPTCAGIAVNKMPARKSRRRWKFPVSAVEDCVPHGASGGA